MSQNEALKEDAAARRKYELELNAYRALRAYHMGRSHAALRRWKEAAVLFDTSVRHMEKVEGGAGGDGAFGSELRAAIDLFWENVETDGASARASHVLELEQEQAATAAPQKAPKSRKPLIERLDEFREDPQLLTKSPNLVALPPAMEAVPAKPLFYDLALNFVEMPDLREKMEGAQPKQKQGAAGISGFVKGLWGWGK